MSRAAPAWCGALPGGVRLALQISANAKHTVVIGVFDDAVKLKLAAPPVDGKANAALIQFLAAALSVPRSDVRITHGLSNKRKRVEVRSATLTPADVCRLLVPSHRR